MTGENSRSDGLTEQEHDWATAFLNIDTRADSPVAAASGANNSFDTAPIVAGQAQACSAEAPASGAAASENGEEENSPPPFGPQETWTLQTIFIEPDNPSAPIGQKQQFEALGIYAGGQSQPETDALIWSSSDPSMISFDDSKRGLATLGNKAGQVTIFARDPNSKKSGKTTITITSNTSELPQDEYDKGEAYRLGFSDGQHEDPKSREAIAGRNNRELSLAYEDGFKEGKTAANKKWDDVGVGVDKIEASKRPAKPGNFSTSQTIDELGIVGSVISILEAQGARMFAKGVVGTTIGAILLPIFAFKLGADIAQKKEDYKQAVRDFVNQFVTITVTDALERSRGLLKATGAPLKALNDTGKKATTDAYGQIYSELDKTLQDYLDDSKKEEAYVALHNAWVIKMSKQWANLMTNPRFQE